MKSVTAVLALGVGFAVVTQASADPRLDEKVYTPFVQNHVAELEVHRGQQIGGATAGEATTVLEGEYGFNDRVSVAVVGDVATSRGQRSRFNGIGLEGVAYVGQIPRTGVDVGLYLEYKHGLHGETDVGEGKVLLSKTADRFQGLANLIVERPLGVPSGEGFASYGYGASATWQTVGNLRLGAEAFGDLGTDHGFLAGRQGAYVGPQLKWEGRPQGSPVEIEIDLGWLAAIGADRDVSRSQVRAGVEL
jgi:hypothetical protein